MKSANIGTSISGPEVIDISPFGVWILYRGKEHFLDYQHFPWVREAPVSQVFNVVEETESHLRWPALDIDLSIESIETPEAFPMVYGNPNGV